MIRRPFISTGYHHIVILNSLNAPAQLPSSKNSAVWIANAIPFERRTMLLTVRTLQPVAIIGMQRQTADDGNPLTFQQMAKCLDPPPPEREDFGKQWVRNWIASRQSWLQGRGSTTIFPLVMLSTCCRDHSTWAGR